MQLNKIKLHSCTTFASAQSQITLDDDYNVPDYRPDIVKVLKEKGELHFDEVKAAAGAAWLKGRLVFRVLYRSDQEKWKNKLSERRDTVSGKTQHGRCTGI